jgi:hypothetical protein
MRLRVLDSGPDSRVINRHMHDVLHIPARVDAPVACDMSGAVDTPDERIRDYGRLFEQALVRRERRSDSVVLAFRNDPDVRARVEEMVRREAACCPFVDYRVQTAGDEVIWTTTNTVEGERRAAADVILDAFHELPEHAGSDAAGFFDRFEVTRR